MPTNAPTGFETYIYDHRQYPGEPWPAGSPVHESRQHCGPLHDPQSLPVPECDDHTIPLIMVEPCYASYSNEVWIHFKRGPHSMMLPRLIAEQLRDALIKVCEKPKQEQPTWKTPVVPVEV